MPTNSLVDEQSGPAAVDTLGSIHPLSRIAELERTVSKLQRELAYNLRVMRGLYLNLPNDGSTETADTRVDFDIEGRIRITSEDDSVTISQGTLADPHQIDLAAAGGGCSVTFSVIDGDTGTCTATACDSTISIVGGTCISTSVSCASGDATVTIAYTGNHFSDVTGDTGTATADSCGDTIAILGDGTYITTVATDGPEQVTISWCLPEVACSERVIMGYAEVCVSGGGFPTLPAGQKYAVAIYRCISAAP